MGESGERPLQESDSAPKPLSVSLCAAPGGRLHTAAVGFYLTMMNKLKCITWLLIALQGLIVAEKTCQKGTHILKDGKSCVPCISGINYTSYSNAPFCFSCTKCDKVLPIDQITKSPCTTTQDTQCECKPGKFINKKDSPEKCSNCTRCPEGMREVKNCTSWNDTQCANQSNGTVDNHPGQPSSPSNSSISTTTIAVVVPAIVSSCCVVIFYLKFRSQEGFKPLGFASPPQKTNASSVLCSLLKGNPELWVAIFEQFRRPRRAPEALNNDTNNHYEMVSLNGNAPLDTIVCEQELESQPQAPLIAQEVQSLGEVEQVLIGAKQGKRKCLVPVEGTNTTKTLRHLFNDIHKIVPVHSWRPLMRRMGLTDNEIQMAESRASCPQEKLYEMLMTWHNKEGMKASVNTLLDALEAQGERVAKEEIQNLLLNSGKFIYEDDRASSVMPM
ncbi:tumor necrosis factor receptor superfamily member 10B-like [Suncus etruscus]|uniref:tumor necrosis factor receptor superfamily member 10B-like n=1 Tax=Suncus etruscus TaxID=109475 RepID=UPI00210FCB72|nr:tumor necrosis factor receptor superfamily member 10B-like [Suncus etruscus]